VSIKKQLVKSSSLVLASSAFNMLGTVVIARYFGTDLYASYIVDMAYLSFFLILLELFPSSFSVFKYQDERHYGDVLASFNLLIAVIVSALIGLTYLTLGPGVFNQFSWWMILYVFVFSLKRYLDIKYQAENRLTEYFAIDLSSSVTRIIFLGLAIYFMPNTADGIWLAMSLSTCISQAYWLYRNPRDLPSMTELSLPGMWQYYCREASEFRKYYLGIGLKKIKDNAIPIAANLFFPSRELTGIFLLGFRGLVFSCGLLRTVEAFLNHRENLRLLHGMPRAKKYLVPIIGQVVAVATAVALSVLSGVQPQYLTIFILAWYIYPYFSNIAMRANFFSRFQPGVISGASVASVATLLFGVFLAEYTASSDGVFFAVILVASELAMFLVFYRRYKLGDDVHVSQANS